MGKLLLKYYDDAKAKAGVQGQIKLAMLTKMSSKVAESAPDSMENINVFKEALSKL
jgi:hypothetical protein